MKTVKEAAQWLRERDHFLILTHRRPDGDAVGSTLGLRGILRLSFPNKEIFESEALRRHLRPIALVANDHQ